MATEAPPSHQSETLNLWSFYASSCGQRIIIYAALKGLNLNYIPVSMRNNEHKAASFLALNPSGALPVLEIVGPGTSSKVLAQSIAIMEYLEETYPSGKVLLPKDAYDRAVVRQLVGVMVCDAYPPSNSRVSKKVQAVRGSEEDQDAFVQEVNLEAFLGYEGLLERYGGEFSFGDSITLADICLIPQVDLAKTYGFDLEAHGLPRTRKVVERLMEMPEFSKSGWRYQVDTPEKFRMS